VTYSCEPSMNSKSTQSTESVFKDYKILIVDDTPVNLGVVVDFLQQDGFGIRIARTGESALKRVQYDKPDVILLDVLMPGMDGFETCRRLKQNETTRDIPVIFMTSLTGTEDKVKGFEAGAVDYVTKPLHQEEVLMRVRTHLRIRDLTLDLQEKNRQLETSSRIERNRLFEAIAQQQQQLRTLNRKLTEVQEAERKELARELHDEMGQALTAININLVEIKRTLPDSSYRLIEKELTEAVQLTEQTLKQVRQMSLNLRPPMLDDLGLTPTLRWYIKQFSRRVGIEAKLIVTGLETRLDPNIETNLFRVVQEALTNVARHSQANSVSVLLTQDEGRICAVIKDDGQGFDFDAAMNHQTDAQGAGLFGIRERVSLLGGTLQISSQAGAGTQLSIEIPIDNPLDIPHV
jgi:signal transduction histidine kinase